MKWDRNEDVLVGGQFRVDFDCPLPQLDTLGAHAYAALEQEERTRPLYALVGKGRLPRREAALTRLMQKPVAGIVRPLADAVVTLASKRRAWAVVLERPEGGSLLAHAKVAPFTEDQLRRTVMPQLVQALEALHGAGLTHRTLRPDRLFWKDVQQAALVLGECFSEPPAYSQPAIYEPAERAATIPAGRGEGVPGCDLYALAVSVVALCLGGEVPCARPETELFEARLVRSSAALVLADARLSSEFRALLSGLLDDDPQRRWSLVDLRLWLKGANPAASVGIKPVPSRPVSFSGASIWNRQVLAHALGRAADGTEEFVRSPAFLNWVQNGLNDAEAARRIRSTLTASAGRSAHGIGVVAAIQRILDPAAPLHLARLAVAADGIGPVLAEAWREDQPEVLTALAKAFQSGLVLEASSALDELVADAPGMRRRIAYVQSLVTRAAIGWGLERAAYELNAGLACHSALLGDIYAPTLGDVLLGLDQRADAIQDTLVDRHVAAFFAVREPILGQLVGRLDGLSDELARLGAELALLAAAQRAAGRPPLRNLTKWFAQRLRRHAERLHGAANRGKAQRTIERLSGTGDLAQFVAEVDVARWREADARDFAKARTDHRRNAAAIRALLAPVTPADAEATDLGQRGAVAAAYAILALALFGTMVVF